MTLVYELTHLVERTQSERFVELMHLHVPAWRARRDEPDHARLAEEKWIQCV